MAPVPRERRPSVHGSELTVCIVHALLTASSALQPAGQEERHHRLAMVLWALFARIPLVHTDYPRQGNSGVLDVAAVP
jgi:hypothetical protein